MRPYGAKKGHLCHCARCCDEEKNGRAKARRLGRAAVLEQLREHEPDPDARYLCDGPGPRR